jgi:PTH1 family peptidyl-tRNA hydrolase
MKLPQHPAPLFNLSQVRAIIGLGNPGTQFERTRHNIGFRLLDAVVQQRSLSWNTKEKYAYVMYNEVLLIKPRTFMNDSGSVLPSLKKKGITPEQILVIHDELEKPFGHVSIHCGGSARGHNGLRSIINQIGHDFWRLRFGIDRPAHKEEVGRYVLQNFTQQEEEALEGLIEKAISLITLPSLS